MSVIHHDVTDEAVAYWDRVDAEFRANLSPEELREYRIWSHEIQAQCPCCGVVDAEIDVTSGADMVGYWWQEVCKECGWLIDAGSDGIEAVR